MPFGFVQWPSGSPPRGRGKVLLHALLDLLDGITPAWAGKRGCGPLPVARSRDHPRVGGEKDKPALILRVVKGSPPRGRGKVLYPASICLYSRITPAWAGKSENVVEICREAWDHPRVGGEKVGQNPMGLIQQGSPPRGRGKAIQKGGVANGIEDHPRVGGEKADCPAGRAEVGGSPPRGRGKAGKPCSNGPEQGITPAWAGKRDGQHGPRYDYQDHPRVGGEKFTGGGFRAWARGSPPRGRGKVLAAGMLADGLGITPAWAGKRSALSGTVPNS